MALRYQEFRDPAAFALAVRPYLMQLEAVHCLMLGLTTTLARPGSSYTGRNLLALVADDNDAVVGALVMTPPFGPLISVVDHPTVIELLADGLFNARQEPPTIFGPVAESDLFASLWSTRKGLTASVAFRERVYQLTRVHRPLSPPAGSSRAATAGDRDMLIAWMFQFNVEAFGADSPEARRAELAIDSRLRDPSAGFFIWEDGEPVALAGFCDPTPNGIRIGPVYTPDAFRGRGYASALTADVAQRLLDRGHAFAFLFTDVANPISNHVYEKIGFEPVTDFKLWSFSDKP